jgi:HK97 family phage major capsid protein
VDVRAHVIALNETRARVVSELNGVLDETAGRERSAEEAQKVARLDARIDEIDVEVREFVDREKRETEAAALREAQSKAFGREPDDNKQVKNANQELRLWLRGEKRLEVVDFETGKRSNGIQTNVRAVMREKELLRAGASPEEVRALAWDTGSVGSTVPTEFDRRLYEVMEANIAALRMPTTRLTTDSGANMEFSRVNAHGIATQVAGQGTALAGTDPTFNKLTLGSFKFGELVKIASEVVSDSGVDIVGFVARDVGRAVARKIDAEIVSGAVVADSMMGGIVGAGTISTGGSLINPTYDKLIDLVYSVNDAYRTGGNAAWLTRDSTAGTLRKLRDGAGGTEGAPLWQFSLTNGIAGAGQPDTLMTYPVFTDPNVASLASDARILAYGDWNGYYLRTIGAGPIVERDDSRFFDTDESAFRGKWRVDGGYQDLTAVNIMKRSV